MQTITIEKWAQNANTMLQNMQKAMQATSIEEPTSLSALLDQYADITQQMNSPMSIGLALEKLIDLAGDNECKVSYDVTKKAGPDQILNQRCWVEILSIDGQDEDLLAIEDNFESALSRIQFDLNTSNLPATEPLCNNLLPKQASAWPPFLWGVDKNGN